MVMVFSLQIIEQIELENLLRDIYRSFNEFERKKVPVFSPMSMVEYSKRIKKYFIN